VRPVRVTVYVVPALRPVIVTMTVPSAGIVFAETVIGDLPVGVGVTNTLPVVGFVLLMVIGKLPAFVICNTAVLLVTSRIVSVADSDVGMWVFVPAPMRPETHP